MEMWRIVECFDAYSISDRGNVKYNKTGRLLKPMVSTSGYAYLHLIKDKKKYTVYIHRILGKAFIDNPKNYPQIDHIDGNKLNNDLSNLRWITISENRLAYGNEQRAEARQRAVIATNQNGKSIEFESRKSAAEYFNCSPTKIKYNYLYQKGSKKGWTFKLS